MTAIINTFLKDHHFLERQKAKQSVFKYHFLKRKSFFKDCFQDL